MPELEFNLSELPPNCLDCERIHESIGRTACSIQNAIGYQLIYEQLTVEQVETYLDVLGALEASAASSHAATQSIIDVSATLSRMYSCPGNDELTGECQLSKAILRNPYR